MTGKVPKVAIIIVGGEGTRLRPITYEIPKPLVPVQGKAVLEHVVDELTYYGVEEIVLSLGYKADKIIEHFNKVKKKSKIDYVVEAKPLGTGGALKFAYQKIKDRVSDDFIAFYGDSLIDFDIDTMYQLHKKRNALITILGKEEADVTGYGVMVLDGDRVTTFVEKPDPKKTPSHTISLGVFIINKKAIPMLPETEPFDLSKDFIAKILDKERVHAFVSKGQFWPTDTHERYEKAIFNWRDYKARNPGG